MRLKILEYKYILYQQSVSEIDLKIYNGFIMIIYYNIWFDLFYVIVHVGKCLLDHT